MNQKLENLTENQIEFDPNKKKTLGYWVWLGLFAISYPVMLVFSLFFTLIIWLFSNISRFFVFLLRLFERK